MMFLLGSFSEHAFKLIKRQSPFSRYRLESAMPRISFQSQKAKELLDWEPVVGVDQGIELAKNRE